MTATGYAHCCYCQKAVEWMASCPFMSCMLLLLAGLMALRILMKVICPIICLAKHISGGRCVSSPEDWVLITGASDGIGKATSLQLAKRGISKFILVARNDAKLKDTQTQLELVAPSPVTVCRVLVDFSSESPEDIFAKISEAVGGKPVGLLVNCVGVSYPHAMYYDEVPLALIEELVSVNVRSTLVVTRAVLPGMKARKRGMIVCVGSGASEIPSDPLYAAYAATKASAEAFCRSLQVEASPFGVVVQCHVPLLVTTKLSKCRTPSLMVPSADKYSACAVRAMGCASSCRSPTVSPYCIHGFILWLSNLLPRFVWNNIRMGQCLSIRKRALNKQEGQKKDS